MSYRSRDQAVADDAAYPPGYTPDQMCAAKGCPNRWAIASSHACTAHHWAPRIDWPRITQEQRNADTDRVLERQNAVPPDVPKLTRADKLAILAGLRGLFTAKPKQPLAWAYALKAREKAGEKLTASQRTCWRNALGEGQEALAPDDDPRTQRLKAETAKRVAEYARRFGLSLDDAGTLLNRGDARAHAFSPESQR